ncbi:MAG: hypothetical protein AAB536_01805 [Patescibacteria group bacterium]
MENENAAQLVTGGIRLVPGISPFGLNLPAYRREQTSNVHHQFFIQTSFPAGFPEDAYMSVVKTVLTEYFQKPFFLHFSLSFWLTTKNRPDDNKV